MFKNTYGFDTDVFKEGLPIHIEDNLPSMAYGFVIGGLEKIDELDYKFTNKSGAYLVKNSSPTMLNLIDVEGESIEIPIRHFIDDNPRMKIQIYTKED